MGTKNTSPAEIILHPQRMKIIHALTNGTRTSMQLVAMVNDVPQATLYRHLGVLLKAGVIEVVAERQVRGAIERSYALAPGKASLAGADLADASTEDHLRYFSTFVAGLLGQFSRYLDRGHTDFEADGVGYREVVLNLSDREFREMVAGLRSLITPLLANKPNKRRTARVLATVLLPYEATPTSTLSKPEK